MSTKRICLMPSYKVTMFYEIYMDVPKGFQSQGRNNLFADSLNPYMALSKHLGNGMPSCVKHWSSLSSDKLSMITHCLSKGTTSILIYVDNMVITEDSLKIFEETKGKLKRAFKMKDLV